MSFLSFINIRSFNEEYGERIKVRGLIQKTIFNLGEELTYVIHLTLPLSLKNHKKLLY